MIVAIGADHGGFELKEQLLVEYVRDDIEFEDVGTFSSESCDYPLIADKVAKCVLSGRADMGILICGTGVGISIAANRNKGIRAALIYSNEVAALAREHNDANVAVFGARTQSKKDIVQYLDTFFATSFSNGERHCRRIAELG